MNYNEIFISIDWIYLVGIIEKVNDIGEVIVSEIWIGMLDGIEYDQINNQLIDDLDISDINEETIKLNSINIYKFIKQEAINLNDINNNNINKDIEKTDEYIEFVTVYSFYKLSLLFNTVEVS